jgi:hypothetical protein
VRLERRAKKQRSPIVRKRRGHSGSTRTFGAGASRFGTPATYPVLWKRTAWSFVDDVIVVVLILR